MEEPIIIKDTSGWINVIDYGICNDETKDVSFRLQEIMDTAPEDSIIYFPKGKYLFENGVKIKKRLTLCGDSYILANVPKNTAGVTQFTFKGMKSPKSENVAIITVKSVRHCIKSICFYSDSCYRDMTPNHEPPTDGKPRFHHDVIINYRNISAVVCEDKQGEPGHYENLFFSGFSGSALDMPNNSTANDITVFTSGLGINTGENSIIANSKVWGCVDGMIISTGTFINGMRVEEIKKIGIKNIGRGLNFITNVTIDQCGYCGFWFDSISNVQISGNITRCGQYYYDVSYDTYLELGSRAKEAYSLLYGNLLESSNIVLSNTNGDNWEDFKENKHKVYIIEALETKGVLLTCNIDATDCIIRSEKGNLTYNNTRQTVRFYNGRLSSINGIGISEEDYEDKVKIKDGNIYINSKDKIIKMHKPEVGDIMSTTLKNKNTLSAHYGGTWEQIGEKVEFGITVYYYKLIEK
ncbi:MULTISPECIES: glycoside hydrolase family 55 protein [unclassified Clostridioides]|uniref:glycoside hydrolase family 55 protein n=1 Tax=unclassified Clostridioides TaxID=2635829 RepID=UPI001D12150B|nr:glycoside hydrolase family 55 protein [Clostridioides sp. ES-S-0171-01]MCC0688767.1 glycoside hydrolase family 55 protein [Clostridioides sp. ES-S-0056-01]MCC0716359.1 glycoside hydrolase family 55 protein [Clostridioides sp. ES-S-0077-01]UDN54083.1 glycoside hydrolase family 55 protein [Clostridioides sp. ES-S-0054-01]